MKKATSTDVARQAGVSQTTVSLVLSGNTQAAISSETRQRVIRAAEELGYQPPQRKRREGGRQQGRRMLVLLVPTLTNPYYTELARTAEDYAETKGMHTVVCNTFRRPEMEKQFLETFGEGQTAGIIYTFLPGFPKEAELMSRRVPSVIIGEKQSNLGICSIELSNRVAGAMLADHLLELGHRKMAFISTPLDQVTLARSQRLEGIRQQLALQGPEASVDVTVPDKISEADRSSDMPYEYAVGRQLTASLLERGTEATALIGVNDMTAFGILDEVRERGLRVPEDFSVCGFDNIFSSRLGAVNLTTIDHRMQARCREAVNMILAQENGAGRPQPHKIEYAPQLVIRGSTGPARKAEGKR